MCLWGDPKGSPHNRASAVMLAAMSASDGPYFDDLERDQELEPALSITIGPGECALYQSIVGDALPLTLSVPLAARVTKEHRPIVNPALVLHVAIGQSTVATRRVIANLFYRGVRLHQLVRVGSTLTTTVTVRGLRETTRHEGRPPRGMALLGITTIDDRDDVVVDFERCALLPFRDPDSDETGHHDVVGGAETDTRLDDWMGWVPKDWDLAPLGNPVDWTVGDIRVDNARDTVTNATALVRLTQNQAAAHRDPAHGQRGRRLVYGGHTIGLAQASLTRMVPNIATVLGWHSCDHVGPVFEDDVLSAGAELVAEAPAPGGRLLAFAVGVDAHRDGESTPVLDWRPVVYAP